MKSGDVISPEVCPCIEPFFLPLDVSVQFVVSIGEKKKFSQVCMFGSLEIRDTLVTRVSNNVSTFCCREASFIGKYGQNPILS